MPHHVNLPDCFGNWVLAHRLRVLVCFGIITVALYVAYKQVPIRASILQGLIADDLRYQAWVDHSELFGGTSDDVLLVATNEGDALFAPDTLNAIRAAARELESLPEVSHVSTFVDAPRISTPSGSRWFNAIRRKFLRHRLLAGQTPRADVLKSAISPWWPEQHEAQRDIDPAELAREIAADPVAGRLIARELGAHAMVVSLTTSSDLHNKANSRIRERIEAILRRHKLGRNAIHCAGTLIIQDWMFEEIIRTFTYIVPVCAIVISVLTFVLFRRLSYVLLTMIIATVAVIWSLGITALAFGEITLLVVGAPGLVLVISTADTIHLISAYMAELRRGLSREDAVRRMFREVGGACVLTSITTFIGFLSMIVIPAATVRHFAVACAVGVAGALLLALTLVPMALMILKPPPVHDSAASLVDRALTKGVNACARTSVSRPRSVIAVHLVVMVSCVLMTLRLDHDADIPGRFPATHPLRQSIVFFNTAMSGTTTVEVLVRVPPEDLLAPRTISSLAMLERELMELAAVRNVISTAGVLQMASDRLRLGWTDGVPGSQEAAESVIRMIEHILPGGVRGLLSKEGGVHRAAVQMNPTRVLEVYDICRQIKNVATRCVAPGMQVQLSGYYPIVGESVREIVKSQQQGFAICFMCVMLVVLAGVRSLRLCLLAALPNLFPLALLGGVLVLTFDVVDTDILGIAIISFSLAVDDTIHFLHRYDVERQSARDTAAALERTFTYTGAAVVRTTCILGLGLLPFALANYLTICMLGTYLVFVLGAAVAGDLLLLPALVMVFDSSRPAASGGDAVPERSE